VRRIVYAGLVPCSPEALAERFLDAETAQDIWPQLGQRSVLRAGTGWSEMATPELGGDPGRPPVRFRLLRPTEVLAVSAGAGAWALHRFLRAEGGCLWVIENHDSRRPGESLSHFARRRRQAAEEVERLVDAAAGYFAERV
jgi:hypothetical protein